MTVIPEICEKCIYFSESNVTCLYYKTKIPEEVNSTQSCEHHTQIDQELGISQYLSLLFNAYMYGNIDIFKSISSRLPSKDMKEIQSLYVPRNFLTHLNLSFKDDPVLVESVNELSGTIDVLNNSVDEFRGKISELEKKAGEGRIKEVVRSFLLKEHKPPHLPDWLYINSRLNSYGQDLEKVNSKTSYLEGKQNHIDHRLKKVEDKVNIAKTVRWMGSIIVTFLIGATSGWLLRWFFP